jgi:hypothetical protein
MFGPRRFLTCFLAGALLTSCGGGGGSSTSGSGTSPQDTTPPSVLNTSPANLASGVPVNALVSATFSENITATAPASVFTLTQSGTAIPGTVAISGSTATFTPAAKLGNSLSYTATLSPGVKDLAGNALGSPFSWSFVTSDCNAITPVQQLNLGTVVSNAMFKALATDGTSIYLWTETAFSSTYGTVFKIDPSSGQILSTTNVPLVPMAPGSTVNGIQFIADIAWHNGALWASGVYVDPNGNFPQGVFRVNLATGLAEAAIPVSAGLTGEIPILQGLASDGTNLYVAIDRNYALSTPVEHVIITFNPATSLQIPLSPALLTTTGQATRLDFGGGYLWVFNNPNFQQVDPVSGRVLSNYCKSDGGANILYLKSNIWSIKDTILMAYRL